jgi:hypothetical protein
MASYTIIIFWFQYSALFLSAISDALRCQFWDEEEDPMYFLHREGLGYLLSTFIRLHQVEMFFFIVFFMLTHYFKFNLYFLLFFSPLGS